MVMQWATKELWVQGMMVDSSAKAVEDTLNAMDGVTGARASLAKSNVVFSYDPGRVEIWSVLEAIRQAGYIASENPPKTASAPVQTQPAGNRSRTIRRKVLRIGGMTCVSCEMRIENRLKKTEGILEAKVSFADGTAKVGYDPQIISLSRIVATIEKLDYTVLNQPAGRQPPDAVQKTEKMPINQLLGIGILLLAGYLIVKNTVGFSFMPIINQNMGYGILFVVGLITSLHCVAMCGGINLSQAISCRDAQNSGSWAKLKPSVLYNAGRVISYTAVGGIVGALGSVVSLSGAAQGVVAIAAGIFMVLMGLNMLNAFPWLRRITPHMPKSIGRKLYAGGTNRGPFYIGLLNGLMPCGPLQAMQIYALGTGSPAKGALAMFTFSIGTVPLMFGFGAVSSFLSGKFTHKMMRVSAVLVMFLGIVMLNRGFSLSGVSFAGAFAAKAAAAGNVASVQGGAQTVTTQLQPNSYTPITVQKGVRVKWLIHADEGAINGCNGTVTIPQYGISKTLSPGDNEIDFTPQRTGTVTYTCSMGMITSTISVVDDVAKAAPAAASQQASSGSSADAVGVAKISGNAQSVTVTVDGSGYSPAILVLQKGVPAKIDFRVSQLSSCNEYVVFPELNGQMDLGSQTSTPQITPQSDFSFQCGMGMLRGYVKVVDDISKIDRNAIRKEAQGYVSAGGGMTCCR